MEVRAMPAQHTEKAQTQMSALQCRPLSAALGAEIVGVDLRRPLDDQTFEQVLAAWHQHLVILLRNQELTEEDQVGFAERFGPPAIIHTKEYIRTHPAVMLISNIREDGKPIGALPDGEMQFHTDQCHQERPAMASMLYAIEVPCVGGNTLFANGYKAYETLPAELGEMQFHTDQCHQERPAMASMLYAIEVPCVGGNTLFANGYKAYETLPAEIKQRIEGRKALNAYDYHTAAMKRGTRLAQGVPFYVHPVVRTHPATGRRALYVNRLMTVR